MNEIEIKKEPVELYKVLKFSGIADSGGEAKSVIADGRISVNGRIETQKRKQIVSGDVITAGNQEFRIRLKE